MSTLIALILAMGLQAKLAAPAWADTASFSASADTMIQENSPNSKAGSKNPLRADGDYPTGTGRESRALLKWDVSSLPDNATIQSALVTLNVTNPSGNSYTAHKVLKSWSEANATWNQASNSSNWQTPGANGSSDRATVVSGTFSPSATQQTSFDLNASLVAGWNSDPASNRGIILLGPNSEDGVEFSSRESSDSKLRPKLTVNYTLPPDDSIPTCTSSLQAAINAAPSGGTVTAAPCIYRESVTINKPLTLVGQSGSEIRGSDVWTGFSQNGSTWVSSKTVPTFSVNGQCLPNTSDCLRPEQVFLDGKPLKQLASNATPSSGQFSLDSSRHVVLGDDPSGRRVEVSVRREWIHGAASNVTIKDFTMKHAANDSQWRAALTNDGYSNWTLSNVNLSYAHGANVSLRGTGNLIANSNIHHGGQLGIHASDGSLTVRDSYLHDNNFENFNPGWEAGALKAARMSALTVDNTEVTRSDQGLWCDLNCTNVVYSNNRVHHNGWSGLFFEVSTGAKIYGNKVYENGWGKAGPYNGSWQGAIHISLSRNAEIYNNIVAWNRSGISIVRYDRGDDPAWENVYGNYVHDNTILSKDYSSSASYNSGSRDHALAWVDQWTGEMYDPAKNNRGFSNDYYFATSEDSTIPRYMWGGKGITSLTSFNSTLGEEQGRYLTQSEKDLLVASAGIPATPETH